MAAIPTLNIDKANQGAKQMLEGLGLDLNLNTDLPCDTLFVMWRQSRGLTIKYNMNFADYDK